MRPSTAWGVYGSSYRELFDAEISPKIQIRAYTLGTNRQHEPPETPYEPTQMPFLSDVAEYLDVRHLIIERALAIASRKKSNPDDMEPYNLAFLKKIKA